jgi:mannose/fructose/N-acetylgalactosamine-specific phosphotransferase system component IIB
MQPHPIPLEGNGHSKDMDIEDMSVFKLCTTPSDKDSQTYDIKVFTLKSGMVEEFILWKKDIERINVGQNVTIAAGKIAITRCLILDGDTLAAFDKVASSYTSVKPGPTMENA